MSKFIVLFATITLMTLVFHQSHQFLPENDLWKEDVLNKSTTGKEMFSKIVDIGYDLYKPLADKNNESLTINKNWDDPTVNANCSRFWGSVTVNMYGGLFRRPEISAEGFALVLCHELGHAYGGTPYISSWRKMSAEGQADYYGAKECLHKVMAKLKLEGYEIEPTSFMENTCEDKYTGKRVDYCIRSLVGGHSTGLLFSTLKKVAVPDYETPDDTVVDETQLSYPATIQCRLDTYLAGTLKKDRPRCWYKP